MCIWWFYCIILQVLKNKVAIFAFKSARKTEGHMAIGQYKKARRLSLNSYSPQCNAFFLVTVSISILNNYSTFKEGRKK